MARGVTNGPGLSRPAPSREVARALRRIPPNVDWAWVRGRIVPVIERPEPGAPSDDPYVTITAECDLTVGFGFDLGHVLVRVGRSAADRWRCGPQVLQRAAYANLRSVARRLAPSTVQFESYEGLDFAILAAPPGLAASLLLTPDQLTRLFGSHDQVFTAPSRSVMLSFSPSAPFGPVMDITQAVASLDPMPIHVGPLFLIDGLLRPFGDPNGTKVTILAEP